MTLSEARVAFIGGGNMGSALIGGIIAAGAHPNRIAVCDPSDEARVRLAQQYGVKATADGREAAADCDVIVLAVKPQILRAATAGIADAITPDQVVLSIAAGVPVASLRAWLPNGVLMRAMPNTPALIGCGITGVYAGAADSADRRLVGDLLSAVGEVVWLDKEDELHVVTAVSGSGPAYFFRFVEALQHAAQAHGIASDVAARLAAATASGAGRLLAESDQDVATLRRNVTSPKGTTEAGLAALDSADPDAVMARVVDAARRRSIELANA